MAVDDGQHAIEDSGEKPLPELDERGDREPIPGEQPPAASESLPDIEFVGTPPASTRHPEVVRSQDSPTTTWVKLATVATAAGTLMAALAAVGALYFSNSTLTNLTLTNLTHAYLLYANLTDANLFETTLTGAYLLHGNLANAVLLGANLADANLGGANLTDADLTRVNLAGIVYDDSARWPVGFTPPPSARP